MNREERLLTSTRKRSILAKKCPGTGERGGSKSVLDGKVVKKGREGDGLCDCRKEKEKGITIALACDKRMHTKMSPTPLQEREEQEKKCRITGKKNAERLPCKEKTRSSACFKKNSRKDRGGRG